MTKLTSLTPNKYNVSNYGSKQIELKETLGKSKETLEKSKETLEKSKQAVNESVSGNSAVLTATSGMNDKKSMYQTLSLVPVVYYTDRFLNTKMAGDEAQSLLGKTASLGDKISSALNLDKIISKFNGKKVSNFIKNNSFTKYFTEEFKAIPKSSMAKRQTLGEEYTSKLFTGLKDAITKPNGLYEVLTAKNSPLKEETVRILEQIKENEKLTTMPLKELCNASDDLIKNGLDTIKPGSLTSAPVRLSELRNKAKAANLETGKSVFGKVLTKANLKTKDVITYGGGLLSAYFLASAIINAAKATKEAPEGEKTSTLMHVLSEQYLGMLLFQPSINILYKAGGNKYRGMSIEGRNALADLVKNANIKGDLTKEGLKVVNLQKKLLLKGVDKDKASQLAGKGLKEAKNLYENLKKDGTKLKLWEKVLKGLGTVLDTGLDTVKLKKGPTLKGFLGGFGRFALIMFVIQPVIQKPMTKLCHKIFGEPKAYLSKQNEGKDKETKNSSTPSTPDNQIRNTSSTNLLNIYGNKTANQIPDNTNDLLGQKTKDGNGTNIATGENESDIAALNLFNKDKKQEEEKEERYIPSTEVHYDNTDQEALIEAQLKEIRKKAYSAQKNIEKYL